MFQLISFPILKTFRLSPNIYRITVLEIFIWVGYYCLIYGQEFSFMVTCVRSPKIKFLTVYPMIYLTPNEYFECGYPHSNVYFCVS